MPQFHYRVGKTDGTVSEGMMEAAHSGHVRCQLEGQGVLVLDVSQSGPGEMWKRLSLLSVGGISSDQFLIFNQELVALLRARLPILRVWTLLIDRTRHPGFQAVLRAIQEAVRGGLALSEAFAQHPQYFPDMYVASIRAGERAGNLPEVLVRYIAYLKMMVGLRHKVKKALAYPVFLVVAGIGVMAFLIAYVMPTFATVYADQQAHLPKGTLMLLAVAQYAQDYFWPAVAAALVGILMLRWTYRSDKGRHTCDRILLATPYLGSILICHYTIQVARTLGTVLGGGAPLVDGLRMAAGAVGNRYFSAAIAQASAKLREGQSLASALGQTRMLPELALEMIAVGEETSSLEPMLADLSEFYEGDLDVTLSQITTWIEPALLLLMGGLVAMILIVMYLPVFQMAATVQ